MTSIEKYSGEYRRPLGSVLFAALILFLVTLTISCFFPGRQAIWRPSFHIPCASHVVILAYVSLYCGMWGLYFAAPAFDTRPGFIGRLCKFQSLRRLLLIASEQWRMHPSALQDGTTHLEADEIDRRYETKAQSAISVVAILAAASVLILDKVFDALLNLPQLPPSARSAFHLALLIGAFASGMFAFVCFLLAVDDFDSIFNYWRKREENFVLDDFFYRRATTPRFAGLGALVLSVCLLFAFISEFLGLLGLGMGFGIFYRHLFPLFKDGQHPSADAVAFRWILVLTPVLLGLLGIIKVQ